MVNRSGIINAVGTYIHRTTAIAFVHDQTATNLQCFWVVSPETSTDCLVNTLNRDATKEGIASSIADPSLDALTGELTRALLTAPWWVGFARKCLL